MKRWGLILALTALGSAAACGTRTAGTPPTAVAVRATAPATAPAPTAGPRSADPGTRPTAEPTAAAPTPAPAQTAAPEPWLVYGDSITKYAFDRPGDRPGDWPPGIAVLNGGIPGATSELAALRLPEYLAWAADARRVGLAFGTNDAYSGVVPVGDFARRMRALATAVRESGREPMLARIPWGRHPQLAGVPAFNDAVDAVTAELGLVPGPDLYTWFAAHEDEVGPDGVHMTAAGDASVRRLWAEALVRGSGPRP